MARQEIRFAGFGGQGLLLAGILLGRTAALYAGKQAAQTQSYGTEARGGASQCNVVIDDKERHPSFQFEESLLPLNLEVFERPGPKDQIERIGLLNYGVEFNSPQHAAPVMLDFEDAWDRTCGHAY